MKPKPAPQNCSATSPLPPTDPRRRAGYQYNQAILRKAKLRDARRIAHNRQLVIAHNERMADPEYAARYLARQSRNASLSSQRKKAGLPPPLNPCKLCGSTPSFVDMTGPRDYVVRIRVQCFAQGCANYSKHCCSQPQAAKSWNLRNPPCPSTTASSPSTTTASPNASAS